MKVLIIGAGINGLAVGVNLLETCPNALVTIYSETVSPNTTGDVAAGLFMPYAIAENDERLCNWLHRTYGFLSKIIATDPNHHKYGLFYQTVYQLSEDTPLKMGIFNEIVGSGHFMNDKELQKFPNFKYGTASTTIISETQKFLIYLQDKFIALGGKINIRRVESFDEVQSISNFPIVINCTGLGSRELCNDLEIHPMRGQVIRVDAPWIKFIVMKKGHYIIPQSDNVVLGGTLQRHDWNVLPDDNDTKYILDGCTKILPGLKNPKILSIQVGLRPARSAVRLESEKRINEKTGMQYTIIHNYGHGGSGFTLFWGCATEVLQLISGILVDGGL